MRNNYPKLCLSDNAVRFSTSMSAAGHVVPGWEIPPRLEAELHWVPAWLAVLEVGSWNWKEKKDDFLQLWDCKKKQFWNVRKECLNDAPSQTAAPQTLSLILGFRFLAYLCCLYKTFAPLPSAKDLVLCKFAAYLDICWKLRSLFIYLFVEFSVPLVLYLGFFVFQVCCFGGFWRGGLMGIFANQSTCPMLANWIWGLWRIREWCWSYSSGHRSLRSVWMQSFSPTWFCCGQPRVLTLWLTSVTVFVLARLEADKVGCIQKGKEVKRFWTSKRGDSESSLASTTGTRDCFSCVHRVLCVVWNIKWYSQMLHLLFWVSS